MISCASLTLMWVSTGLLCVNDIRFRGPSWGATWSGVKKRLIQVFVCEISID